MLCSETAQAVNAPAELQHQLSPCLQEHSEFDVVRNSVHSSLRRLCGDVAMRTPKALLKLANMQHLCAKFAGTLRPGCGDAALLVRLQPLCNLSY